MVDKADFQAETSLGWHRFYLTWFCSLRHHINTVCLVNWAFFKIQDGVQDGRQPLGCTIRGLFLQPLSIFGWHLCFLICFRSPRIQWKYMRKHYRGHMSILKHFGVAQWRLPCKMTKDNINVGAHFQGDSNPLLRPRVRRYSWKHFCGYFSIPMLSKTLSHLIFEMLLMLGFCAVYCVCIAQLRFSKFQFMLLSVYFPVQNAWCSQAIEKLHDLVHTS